MAIEAHSPAAGADARFDVPSSRSCCSFAGPCGVRSARPSRTASGCWYRFRSLRCCCRARRARAPSSSRMCRLDPVYSLVQRSLSVPLDTSTSDQLVRVAARAWGVGAALCLVWFLGLQRAYVRGARALSEDSGTLRAESSAGCPALLGVRRPRVVLPNDFERRYTVQEQALVLAHENVHLERRDTLWNALVVLIRCVFWFNPLGSRRGGLHARRIRSSPAMRR